MTNRHSLWLAIVVLLAATWGRASAAPSNEFVWDEQKGVWVRTAAPAEGSPAGELSLVRKYIEEGKQAKAVKVAKKLIKRYPRDAACEEAMMLAGQAEIARGRYYQGFEWFEKQLNRFPNGQYYERALNREFEIAEAFLAGRKRIIYKFFRVSARDDGLEILSRIAEHAPATTIAQQSMLRIADYHYFDRADYPAAAEAYDQFLELFAKSPKAPYAMLQAARAMQASFRGIAHDETPLIDAQERFLALARMYPQAAKKASVHSILEQIADGRAEKLYAAAEFYERTGRPSSAAFYYRNVADEFPQTHWAENARVSMTRLGQIPPGKPAAPVPVGPAQPLPTTQEGGSDK